MCLAKRIIDHFALCVLSHLAMSACQISSSIATSRARMAIVAVLIDVLMVVYCPKRERIGLCCFLRIS